MQLQNDVYIDEATHTYWHRITKCQYVSVSKFLDHFEEKADWDAIALNCSRSKKGKYVGMSKDQILKAWDDNRNKAANHGTRIHKVLEDYAKYFTIAPEDEEFRPMVESIFAEKTQYIRKYQEVILYINFKDQSGKFAGIAGTVDEILIVNKSLLADFEDYKSNINKGIEMFNEKGKTKLFPINHLQDCNYVRYGAQLSLYAYMYQCLTNGGIRSLNIRFIPPENYLMHRKIPCSYILSDIKNMINHFELNHNNCINIIETKIEEPYEI